MQVTLGFFTVHDNVLSGADNVVWLKFIYHAKSSSLLRNSVQSSWKPVSQGSTINWKHGKKNRYGQFLISNRLMSLRIFASYRAMHWSWDVFHCKRQLKLTWIRPMLPTACCGSMSNLRLVNFVLLRRHQMSFVETKRQSIITNPMVNARSLRGYKTAKPTAYKLCA